ncbi:MAG: FkbM family methyltransferase [Candidatus Acidiferrales bacterium]
MSAKRIREASLHRRVYLTLKDVVRAMLPNSYLLQRDLRKQLKEGEPELRIVPYLCRRSEISIDVGANHGIYSSLFSQYSDHVIAVEPHPGLADRLRRLLSSSVKVLSFAASNQDSVSEFYIPALDGREVHTRSSLEADVNREMITRTILVEKRRLGRVAARSR